MTDQTSAAQTLAARIRDNVIGEGATIPGPFGPRPLVYADYTASGRCLDFIENAIRQLAAPFYANTHTETSYSGLQTTRLREDARQAIRSAVGADSRHAVIFTGSGATSAIHKLACVLGLRDHMETVSDNDRPVIFVGPYEHHSNDLVWRESSAELVRIPLNDAGELCLVVLEEELAKRQDRTLKIGSFSAASNVTGVKTDMRALGRILHANGAWFFSDYAAGGPYLAIDMKESAPGANDHCDAIFLSPHKFIGGPGASGVLVADRRLFANAVPTVPGGGTVSYVNASLHRYVSDIERREEAGTPSILGDIRAGLVFALKRDLGTDFIESTEHRTVAHAFDRWNQNPNIEILGPQTTDRLAIFSFNIRAGKGLLHPNFVVALLNDLFGLQVRGGCSCAGPYGHDLLHIDAETSARYDTLLAKSLNVFRPGWVRLSFNSFFDQGTIDYIIEAVDFIARRGVDFLPLYDVDPRSGRWTFNGESTKAAFDFNDLRSFWNGTPPAATETARPDFRAILATAEALANDAAKSPRHQACADEITNASRWFVTVDDFASK
jgi:selenocysteine lyase/cysteine desulfurase